MATTESVAPFMIYHRHFWYDSLNLEIAFSQDNFSALHILYDTGRCIVGLSVIWIYSTVLYPIYCTVLYLFPHFDHFESYSGNRPNIRSTISTCTVSVQWQW